MGWESETVRYRRVGWDVRLGWVDWGLGWDERGVDFEGERRRRESGLRLVCVELILFMWSEVDELTVRAR